jgi:hypothetical protein
MIILSFPKYLSIIISQVAFTLFFTAVTVNFKDILSFVLKNIFVQEKEGIVDK